MMPCVSIHFHEQCLNCNQKHCGLHDILVEVRDASLEILEKKSLLDIID